MGAQFLQDGDSLPGQRHLVRFAVQLARLLALHAGGGDSPGGSGQVDFRPFAPAQFARPEQQQGQQAQRSVHHGRALVGMDGAQQLAQALGCGDGRKVLHQRAAQGVFRVANISTLFVLISFFLDF